MKYTVELYNKGRIVDSAKIFAKSHKQAVTKMFSYETWQHAVVEGKTTKRYSSTLKAINEFPKAFKSFVSSITILFGNYAETYEFNSTQERDEVYRELCTELESAKHVNPDPQPTNITASSVETSGLPSGSTSKKTWNTSAVYAMIRDALTPTNTGANSGSDSAKDTAWNTWSFGYTPSPSKQSQILPRQLEAVVKDIAVGTIAEAMYGKFYFVFGMAKMIGEKHTFKHHSTYKDFYTHLGTGFAFHRSWLEFIEPLTEEEKKIAALHRRYHAKVKDVQVGTVAITDDMADSFVPPMSAMAGQLHTFTKLKPEWYKCNSYHFHASWLEFVEPLTEKEKAIASLPKGS